MYVFLSYARENRQIAERVRATLTAAGFDCFLDTASLPPGQEFNARIGRAIDRADLFIVLLSAPALEPGSYVITELSFAERKWRNPAGYVLPVAIGDLDYGTVPAYLRPINLLQPRGTSKPRSSRGSGNASSGAAAAPKTRLASGSNGGADSTSRHSVANGGCPRVTSQRF